MKPAADEDSDEDFFDDDNSDSEDWIYEYICC